MAETKKYKTSERQRIYGVKYHEENKETRNEAARLLWEQVPARKEASRRKKLMSRFGITVEQYDSMLALQNEVCKICGNPEKIENRRLAVDHDHESGRVRGLLCFKCNTMVGHIERSGISVIHSVLDYLEVESNVRS